MNLKREVYDKFILPVTTYRLETTTLTSQSADRLRVAYNAMKRAISGEIEWEIKKLEESQVAELKCSWVGHFARQNSEKWTIRVVLWEPREVEVGHKDAG